ncbi:DUF2889 domain-containing protein [Pseudomonas sp. MAG733B]|uniref:DUF2889 domain-containing protein n=1 Tax=Pseudomonas sp. MAG733B TaxID=3122079 RepID=UPI0030D56650
MKQIASNESARKALHTRQVICTGYLRSDGLIDLEGRLLDTKHHDHDAYYKLIPAGAPVHRMHIVLTTDLQFVIHNVEAIMDDIPTPFCPEIVAAYKSLIGLKVGPGFKKQMIQRVGGVQGCTHLTELLGPMATTLYQSTVDLLREAERERAARDPDYVAPKPWFIGTCHAHSTDREEVRNRWPDAEPVPIHLIAANR